MIEQKKLKAELMRVQAGKAEMEYQIELKKEEITRLENSMLHQEKAELELVNKIKQLGDK